ncbi:hypothetical protein Tco_1085614, partial [Tanacetum coccineum]
HHDNTPRIHKGTGFDNQRAVNVVGARENVADWRDDTDDKPDDQELEAHYMVQNDDDNYNVFANDSEHPEKPEYVNDTYLEEQGDTNITVDSLDMSTNGETVDQDDDDLARERDLLASLIDKLKCEIDDNKNRNKLKDFKTKNKSLESSNNYFKEANKELPKTNQLMFKDLKKFQAEIDRYHDLNYASRVEIDCAKAKEMKMKFIAHQETISIMSQEKEAQKMFHKTHEDKELEKVIALENKIKILDDIVYKTGQSVHTMNMLNRNCKTSFVKPEFLKKAQRANPRLYDINCYNDNLAFMLAPESDEMIHLAHESRSKLRVIPTTSVSRPQLKSNRLEDRVMHNNSEGKKQVEDHCRNSKFSNNKTSVTACNDSLNAKTSNVNFVYVTCGKCMLNDNHDMCVLHYINGVNSRTKMPMAVPISIREPKQTVNQSIATTLKRTVVAESTNQKPRSTIRKQYEQISKTCKWWYCKITPPGYKWKPKSSTMNVELNLVEIVLFIVDFGCSKHMKGNLKLLSNFVEKFLGTVKFGNDQIASILGYGELVQGNVTIKRVYYVKGLNHNLFSVGQFYDADLEVAFQKSTCYIHDLKGNDLLTGSYGTDLYSITLQDTSTPNPICLMAKESSSQAWLWHLSHPAKAETRGVTSWISSQHNGVNNREN